MQTLLASAPVKVIQLQGSVHAANVTEFRQQLFGTMSNADQTALLVDLSRVEFIDSAGLMVLVSGLSLAQQLGKRLSLCSVNPTIQMIFELTQLDRVFEIFESPQAFAAAIA